MNRYDLREALNAIDPTFLSYEDWCKVGMALKAEGYGEELFDEWSRRDSTRYHAGECEKKWRSFSGSGVTGGTLMSIAFDSGYTPPINPACDKAFEWNDTIDSAWIEDTTLDEAERWDPARDLKAYISALFNSEDYVGYVTGVWEKDGRWLPKIGNFDRTAGELLDGLNRCGGDIGSVFGDTNKDAGAWIRFNPLDGKGVKNDNVTEYRFCLVESDTIDPEKQNTLIRELRLPVAALVHSGGKSIHAIVKIDAPDFAEYRKRVDFLYEVCSQNGLPVDKQNKNPSRLSRMPGIMRGENRQYLIATNIGLASFTEWEDWYIAEQDVFPDITTFDEEIGSQLPEPDEIVAGVLSRGDKMMIAGPSKAGKTFALLELAIAIAEGRDWLGMTCTKADVLYINLEIKRIDRIRRMRAIYDAIGVSPEGASRLHMLDLRGRAAPIKELTSKIIRSAVKFRPAAIIIDPIYKIMMGDENSAKDVGEFCNTLDKICTELDTAVIYCHHHSKGAQDAKSSMDRASGSGVFARDVDALLDLSELHLTAEMRRELSLDEHATAWSLEATLREFVRPEPKNIIFTYPIHKIDRTDILCDAVSPAEHSVKKQQKKRAEIASDKAAITRAIHLENFREAIKKCTADGKIPTKKDLIPYLENLEEEEIDRGKINNWMRSWKKNNEAVFMIDNEGGGRILEKPW